MSDEMTRMGVSGRLMWTCLSIYWIRSSVRYHSQSTPVASRQPQPTDRRESTRVSLNPLFLPEKRTELDCVWLFYMHLAEATS